MTALGAVAGVATAFFAPWQLAVLTGWIVASSAFLVVVWRLVFTADGERTRQTATREDDSRTVASLLVVVACTASLAGAGVALHKAGQVDGAQSVLLTVASVLVSVTVAPLGLR